MGWNEFEFLEEDWDYYPTRRRALRRGFAERFAGETARPRPRIDVACTGCADMGCVPMLRDAVFEAIQLANDAADKVEIASRLGRDDPDKAVRQTAALFRAFFCHDPSTPIPWARNEASGLSIANRLRSVAKELGGGRHILFLCLPTRDNCAGGDPTCCPAQDVNARTVPEDCRTPAGCTIRLCPGFWTDMRLRGLPDVDRRAGTIIHEMLHMLYASRTGGIRDEGKRANAHCYKAFVLRVNGYGRDPIATEGCGAC